jgi:hypothetical protein
MQAARPVVFSFILFLSILSYSSCHSPSGKQEKNSAKKEEVTVLDTIAPAALPAIYKPDSSARYLGTYSGSFGNDGIITLVLNYVSGRTASGYNVHKGLRRNVNGEVTWEGGKLHFVLKEPGDNRFDGVFNFSMDTTNRKIEGEWVHSGGVTLTRVKLKLMRMQWDESAGDNDWNHADTALDFHNNGTCKLEITPANDYAQKVVVRGNFDKKKDTFLIEWEKNPYIGVSVKMVEYSKMVADSRGDSTNHLFLRGGGMLFAARGEPME